MRYLVVVEKAGRGYAAYAPDLPGCVATGTTRARTERAMERAIRFHLEGLRSEESEVPSARSTATYVDVSRRASGAR